MAEMEKQEIGKQALQIAMEHRVEKVHLPLSIKREERTDIAFNLMRTAALSMYAFIAFGHCPRDLMIMKAAGQKEAFTQMTRCLCFLADFLRDSADLTELIDELENNLGPQYVDPLKKFVEIKKAIRQIVLDFKPGGHQIGKTNLRQPSLIGMGALCAALGVRASVKLKESHDRCCRISALASIAGL